MRAWYHSSGGGSPVGLTRSPHFASSRWASSTLAGRAGGREAMGATVGVKGGRRRPGAGRCTSPRAGLRRAGTRGGGGGGAAGRVRVGDAGGEILAYLALSDSVSHGRGHGWGGRSAQDRRGSGDEERLTGAVDLNSPSGAFPRAISAVVGRRGRKRRARRSSVARSEPTIPACRGPTRRRVPWRRGGERTVRPGRSSSGACLRRQTMKSSAPACPSARWRRIAPAGLGAAVAASSQVEQRAYGALYRRGGRVRVGNGGGMSNGALGTRGQRLFASLGWSAPTIVAVGGRIRRQSRHRRVGV